MKNGTVYGSRIKKEYAKIKRTAPPVELPEPDDALHRLAIAILGTQCSDREAERAIARAMDTLVDWNEWRVSSAIEADRACGNTIPHGVERCAMLITALQSVFDHENLMSLERLTTMSRRDARRFLDGIEGSNAYASASVVLWSLGGHAIPVNDRLLRNLQEADLVNPSASRAEVQAFLERHVSAADAREFCVLMGTFSAKKKTTSARAPKATKKKKTSGTARKAS